MYELCNDLNLLSFGFSVGRDRVQCSVLVIDQCISSAAVRHDVNVVIARMTYTWTTGHAQGCYACSSGVLPLPLFGARERGDPPVNPAGIAEAGRLTRFVLKTCVGVSF